MWQAGAGGQGVSQVEAPVLVFEQEQRRLTAKAETARVADSVHAVLASAPAANVDDADGARAKSATQPLKKGVARITSSLMVYSDLARQAEFSGGVKVLDGSGEMRAEQATVFLRAASAGKASKTAGATTGAAPGTAVGPGSNLTGLFGGSVERIVATHRIEITQPGREATGERLVYTASDQMFVLTGTAAAPPKVVDATQGTTTGAMLRFHSGDDSVVVSGIDGEGPARRVRTETSVQKGANAPTGTMGQGHR
jgi:lipopolysaccharide export system protein LptA